MIPEIGHLALWLALLFAFGLALLPALGVVRNDASLLASAGIFATGQFIFACCAILALAFAFATDDFSVAYVAHNANSLLPLHYKLSALWGAHEGSMLLWIVVMCTWTLAATIGSRSLAPDIRVAMLSVLGMLSFGFILFSLITSNPFERLLPFPPIDGADLNPQLQDFGLTVHPPMLYIGYIGFSVAFSVAVAALWCGRLDAALVRWVRPWVNVSWSFLGLGIVLGSWWAYYELGWGGWWFWDAVENASFMPWLVATALMHSLVATDGRGLFKRWTLLLAILTFSLSLLGAFLVRSGVLTSVHSFAVDPVRGLFILIFFSLVMGGSLGLYAIRAPSLVSDGGYRASSREALLLGNNLFLVVATGAILLGTLFPLAYEAFTQGEKLSVGAPYFNAVFLPLMLCLALLMALAPVLRWRQTPLASILMNLRWPVLCSLVFAPALSWFLGLRWQVSLVSALALWIFSILMTSLIRRYRQSAGFASLTPAWLAMWFGHAGFAVCMLGVVLTSQLTVERDLLLAPGQEVTLADYRFHFVGVNRLKGPNYLADQGVLTVTSPALFSTGWLGRTFQLTPEKRYYPVRNVTMTEAAIRAGFWRDIYIALGEARGDEGTWSVRIQYKPFVRWIWLGGIVMALAGLLALFDRAYHLYRKKPIAPSAAQGGAAT